MKKLSLFMLSIAILLSTFGCSNVEETPSEVIPDSVIEEEQTSAELVSQYSVAELEEMQKSVSPYMEELGIRILNVNVQTHYLEITVHESTEELMQKLSDIVPLDACKIKILPLGVTIELTTQE